MAGPHILAVSGSLRTGGFNRMLLEAAVAHARSLGADVDVVDLKTLNLPLYDGDVEAQGLPPAVAELRERLGKARGLIIASPEYNSSIPGGLKNAIDWVSRPPGRLFQEKWVAMMGASPGVFGTARMQPHLRQVMSSVGAHVLPTQVHVQKAAEAFTPEGRLRDEARQKEVEALVGTLVSRLKG
ncbi:NAD(P)H-dependent oxidoreductase [Pyxidicoccus fallax]|uniref:NAD(P)H-dependent oxidoreductase n=1 Tax=Pyxidicoccus fallax TaxID=394095 RepID=A0A848LBE2_9BACT|nr:NAD(P)H-dependent oxidoreductase [Pyxidicoccus fallax]NMO15806.1 NAD(P)H-dependent oxidoreductase [Pyxidicoccus fallax]NPC84430.1 NAD(P)H-dependent oxidoreductase [Pyxidicoccus fallax]